MSQEDTSMSSHNDESVHKKATQKSDETLVKPAPKDTTGTKRRTRKPEMEIYVPRARRLMAANQSKSNHTTPGQQRNVDPSSSNRTENVSHSEAKSTEPKIGRNQETGSKTTETLTKIIETRPADKETTQKDIKHIRGSQESTEEVDRYLDCTDSAKNVKNVRKEQESQLGYHKKNHYFDKSKNNFKRFINEQEYDNSHYDMVIRERKSKNVMQFEQGSGHHNYRDEFEVHKISPAGDRPNNMLDENDRINQGRSRNKSRGKYSDSRCLGRQEPYHDDWRNCDRLQSRQFQNQERSIAKDEVYYDEYDNSHRSRPEFKTNRPDKSNYSNVRELKSWRQNPRSEWRRTGYQDNYKNSSDVSSDAIVNNDRNRVDKDVKQNTHTAIIEDNLKDNKKVNKVVSCSSDQHESSLPGDICQRNLLLLNDYWEKQSGRGNNKEKSTKTKSTLRPSGVERAEAMIEVCNIGDHSKLSHKGGQKQQQLHNNNTDNVQADIADSKGDRKSDVRQSHNTENETPEKNDTHENICQSSLSAPKESGDICHNDRVILSESEVDHRDKIKIQEDSEVHVGVHGMHNYSFNETETIQSLQKKEKELFNMMDYDDMIESLDDCEQIDNVPSDCNLVTDAKWQICDDKFSNLDNLVNAEASDRDRNFNSPANINVSVGAVQAGHAFSQETFSSHIVESVSVSASIDHYNLSNLSDAKSEPKSWQTWVPAKDLITSYGSSRSHSPSSTCSESSVKVPSKDKLLPRAKSLEPKCVLDSECGETSVITVSHGLNKAKDAVNKTLILFQSETTQLTHGTNIANEKLGYQTMITEDNKFSSDVALNNIYINNEHNTSSHRDLTPAEKGTVLLNLINKGSNPERDFSSEYQQSCIKNKLSNDDSISEYRKNIDIVEDYVPNDLPTSTDFYPIATSSLADDTKTLFTNKPSKLALVKSLPAIHNNNNDFRENGNNANINAADLTEEAISIYSLPRSIEDEVRDQVKNKSEIRCSTIESLEKNSDTSFQPLNTSLHSPCLSLNEWPAVSHQIEKVKVDTTAESSLTYVASKEVNLAKISDHAIDSKINNSHTNGVFDAYDNCRKEVDDMGKCSIDANVMNAVADTSQIGLQQLDHEVGNYETSQSNVNQSIFNENCSDLPNKSDVSELLKQTKNSDDPISDIENIHVLNSTPCISEETLCDATENTKLNENVALPHSSSYSLESETEIGLSADTSTEIDESSDEDSWFNQFDENGDCIDSSKLQELKAAVGEMTIVKPKTRKLSKMIDYDLKNEDYGHVLEIYNFLPDLVTSDLMQSLFKFQSRGVAIKWVDDTHALAIFDSSIVAQEALTGVYANIKVRPMSEASQQSRSKARYAIDHILPYKERPQTSAVTAHRMVAGALGLSPQLTKEQRDEDRKKIREAREKKRQAKQNQNLAWDGAYGKCAMDDII